MRHCPDLLRVRLPLVPHIDGYLLYIGQHWLIGSSTNEIRKGSVIRIDGRLQDKLVVTKWTVKCVKQKYERINTHKQYAQPFDTILSNERAARVSLSQGPDKYYRHPDHRIVLKPHWPEEAGPETANTITWLKDRLERT